MFEPIRERELKKLQKINTAMYKMNTNKRDLRLTLKYIFQE